MERYRDENEAYPPDSRASGDSATTASSRSIVLETLNANGHADRNAKSREIPTEGPDAPLIGQKEEGLYDEEQAVYLRSKEEPMSDKTKRAIWTLCGLCLVGWLIALFLFLSQGTYRHSSTVPHDPAATTTRGSGKTITLDQVMSGQWSPRRQSISWIAGSNGEDGLLLERGGSGGKDWLVVEDVRSRKPGVAALEKKSLIKYSGFKVNGQQVYASDAVPSPDLKKVLVSSDTQKNWRHSSKSRFWIYDVESQTAEPLDPKDQNTWCQLATWAPTSDSIIFTRNNNLYIRDLKKDSVTAITKDGGKNVFNGVPDWVYEEEVFAGASTTWISHNGDFVAYLRINETTVPEYPLEYFVSRPSGKMPEPGEENYPEERRIKYPKAGAPNPITELWFYDIATTEKYAVSVDNDFSDEDRLITEVIWAGKDGKVLIKETERESVIQKVLLIDVPRKAGKVVREVNITAIDGGWFEVSQDTKFVPGDPSNGRAHDGYVDTVIYDGYNHLAYFTPPDNPDPILLTSGAWEVVSAPSAIDLKNNLVYFSATKEGPTQRHTYSVDLSGKKIQPVTDTSQQGYSYVQFSTGAGYSLVSYMGPNIPTQKVVNTPSNSENFEYALEDNAALAKFAAEHELPLKIFSTVNVDGYDLEVVERRPPHFDASKKYPVLFYLYNGPGSQQVDKQFKVDFQSYVAANLGYIVVTVDGRGAGYKGRNFRTVVRGNLGTFEAHDQIETARIWASKTYVDESRMAIWGWSYGGFMTLKTLERDGGRTFKYGMAVAPVTDWRFYDSIYTERYMYMPQNNPGGYENTAISNITALSENVRFLIMHGVADDNVHFQNSLTLLDKLDLAGVENYDFHAFPDSDHGIYFHNANRMVYDRLNNWLVNAFNGEWLKTEDPHPIAKRQAPNHIN
ncbi:hypothetical protein MMC25_007173 [Agyrium rufum]|nr:hypothetical protein [Agyrium rufum]